MTASAPLQDEPLPVSIALVQNDAEVLRTPSYDLRGLLQRYAGKEHRHWRIETFSDRSFPSLLAAGGRFDAIVFGFNAIHNTPQLKAALKKRPPVDNLLVLHQLDADCLEFMRGEVRLGLKNFARLNKKTMRPGESRDPSEEPVLNWPCSPLVDGELHAHALRYFEYEPETVWRTVLATARASEQVPVVVRTVGTFPQRIVACSLLLETVSASGPETLHEHQALLLNMVDYCARGQTDVAVLAEQEPEVARRRAAKLRLQGTRAVVVRQAADGPVSLDSWPIAGAARVLLSEVPEAPGPWEQNGGVLVSHEADGSMLLRTQSSDSDWVAVRWATWFRSVEPAVWLQKIFRSRAVLSTLVVIRDKLGDCAAADRVELPEPTEFRGEVHDRLAARLGPRMGRQLNFEQTVSTTAAACDLLSLVKGGLPGRRRPLRNWLRSAATSAPLEDQLDIARCLRDKRLLRSTVDLPTKRPVSALAVTRLCEAAVACGEVPALPDWFEKAVTSSALAAELDGNLQLSASYVAATLAARSAFPDSALGRPTEDTKEVEDVLDHAVATIVRLGSLPRLDTGDPTDIDPENISLETQAMTRYMELDDARTSLISTHASWVSPKTLESVLRENERARRAETEVKRAQQPLTASFPLIAAGMLAVLIGAILSAGNPLGINGRGIRIPLGMFILLGVLVLIAYVIRFGLLRMLHERNPNKVFAQWTIVLLALGTVGIGLAKFGNYESAFAGVTSTSAAGLVLLFLFVLLAARGLAPRAALSIPQALGVSDKFPALRDWALSYVGSERKKKA